MEATGVSHIAICVRDMEKSLTFYRDILKMRVVLDQVQDTTKGGLPHVYGHARKTRRTVHVRSGEDNTIPSLVITTHPGEEADGGPIKLDQVGISHVSFSVKDLNGLVAELQASGVELAAPLEAFTNAQGIVSSIFAYDPDGILVQFDSAGS